jgi:hypothetical protein
MVGRGNYSMDRIAPTGSRLGSRDSLEMPNPHTGEYGGSVQQDIVGNNLIRGIVPGNTLFNKVLTGY